MSLNKVIPSCAVLEVTMICIHTSTAIWDRYPDHTWIDLIDAIFMIFIPLNLCYTIIWAVYLRNREWTKKLGIVRYCQSAVLALLGGSMIITAFGVRLSSESSCFQKGRKTCVTYELRAIVGLLAVADSIFHTRRPTWPLNSSGGHKSQLGEASLEHDLPSYEEPPSYSDVEKSLSYNHTDSYRKHFPNANIADEINHI